MRIAENWKDYKIIDTSSGDKLESWGGKVLVRPDPQIIWKSPKRSDLWTKADGETEELPSENAHLGASCVRGRDTPVQDGEFVLENGVETGMDYNTVLALIGTQVFSLNRL